MLKIASACIAHETNVFSSQKTDLEEFKKRTLLYGKDILNHFKGTKTSFGGFLEASKIEQFELIPIIWASAHPSGLVTRETYKYLINYLLESLNEIKDLNGILLSLHGAMVAEDTDDADGFLLESLRKKVGKDVPIVATLDLHANISPLMVEMADLLITYDTYPHVDVYDRALEAGILIKKLAKKELNPVKVLKQPLMLLSAPKQKTNYFPMKKVIDLAHQIEANDEVINVSVATGFPWSDVEKAGFSILVTTNNNLQLAEEKANDLFSLTWSLRRDFLAELTPVDEAVKYCFQADEGPIVIADISDNPGGGAPCDNTIILKKLIESKVKNVVIATIVDPEAVNTAIEAGIGNFVDMKIGAKTADSFGGPVDVKGYVKRISDGQFINKGPMGTGSLTNLGRTVLLDCEGIEIILTERRVQPTDLELYRHLGVEPTEKKVLVVKSSVHFRASHEPIAKKIIEVDTPGILSSRLAGFNFKKVRRPIFPLDVEMLGITELKTFNED